MKHIQRHILYIGIILLFLPGCQKKYPVAEKLLQAETMMNEHPDSALNLLKGIDQPELQTQEHHARYALLYSQALDKNYIDLTNDSLINIAVDYYKDRDDVRAKFLSCYYLGRIYTNANNLTQATLAYMCPEEPCPKPRSRLHSSMRRPIGWRCSATTALPVSRHTEGTFAQTELPHDGG